MASKPRYYREIIYTSLDRSVECTFPNTLKLAYITPIYKASCKMDVKNYILVSILPVISKVIEKAVTQQLTEYIARSQLLNPSQYGFRRGYSTESMDSIVSDKPNPMPTQISKHTLRACLRAQ